MTYLPPPPPPRTNKTLIIILSSVAGALLLACGGCVVLGLAFGNAEPKSIATTPRPVATQPAAPPSAAPATTKPAPTTAAPSSVAPTTAVMPNLVGINAAVAQDQLNKLGFSRVDFGTTDGSLVLVVANWTVSKQSAKAGQRIPTDTLIVLTCTKG